MNQLSIDRLQEACGTTGQLRAHIECEGKPGVVDKSFFLPCLLVGRDPNTDLFLDDAQVSQRHAFFQVLGGRLFAVDLRSRTGTHWENGPKSSGWIAPGAAVRIGPFRIHFDGDGLTDVAPTPAEWNPLTSPAPELADLPDVTLEFLHGPTRPMTWRVNQALTLIGRANECGICLRDASVSFFHGYLLRTPAGTWVVDLFSRGGILLNGRRVRWGRLDAGDQLQVGNFLLRSRPEGPVHAGQPLPADGSGVRPTVAPDHDSHPEIVNGNSAAAPVSTRASVPVVASGRSLDRASLQEAILTPLVNQFAALQSQMVAQFQQSILMMVDRFREMHREQFGLIRQEVDRLHQITEELQSLQAQVDKPSQAARPTTSPVAPNPVPTSPAVAPAEAPADQEAAADPLVSTKLPPLELPQPTTDANDGAVHIWLYDRITELQRERQSTLKKILNFLSGK